MRSMWSGNLMLSALVAPAVKAAKAEDGYDGDVALHEVCKCHHKPFDRAHRCAESGTLRTQVGTAKAVESKGKYVVVDEGTLKAIDQAISSKVLEIEAVVDYGELPLEHVVGSYYLYADPKDAAAAAQLAVITRALADTGKAIVSRWAPRTSERPVAIFPAGETLMMVQLAYSAEIKPVDPDVIAHSQVSVSDREVALATQLLDAFPDECDFATFEDRKVKMKNDAVQAALKGKPIPTQATPRIAPAAAPDLLASLEAAVAGVGTATKKAPAKRRTSKAKATA